MKRSSIFLILLLSLSGCMSTKAIFHSSWNPSVKPSYTDYIDAYWWGLVSDRDNKINLAQVCLDQKPLAFQRIKMADDIILSVVTVGIYTPTTVRVWCGEY